MSQLEKSSDVENPHIFALHTIRNWRSPNNLFNDGSLALGGMFEY